MHRLDDHDGPDPIVIFYSGQGTDHRARHLADILALDDRQLEADHDFIQWLFPLRKRSPVNPAAPLVTRQTQTEFEESPVLREILCLACGRMMSFYGFQCDRYDDAPPVIIPGPVFRERIESWLTPGNHNHLRITRILRCLTLLGREPCSRAVCRAMTRTAADHPGRVSADSLRFWRQTQLP